MSKIILSESSKAPPGLKAFSSLHWEHADREHYGRTDIDTNTRTHYVTAMIDDEIVGFARVIIDMGVMTLEDLLVSYDHHRQGIGSRLLERVEILCERECCHVIELITGKDWSARKLYEKHGFQLLAELPEYYARRDFVLMTKRISL